MAFIIITIVCRWLFNLNVFSLDLKQQLNCLQNLFKHQPGKLTECSFLLFFCHPLYAAAEFAVLTVVQCWSALQNVMKGADVYDETIHYPWLLRLTKSESLSE